MNTTTAAVLAGLIVVCGKWAQKKEITIRIVVGIAVMSIILAIVGAINEQLARKLGVLFVVCALFIPVGGGDPPIVALVNGLLLGKGPGGAAPDSGAGASGGSSGNSLANTFPGAATAAAAAGKGLGLTTQVTGAAAQASAAMPGNPLAGPLGVAHRIGSGIKKLWDKYNPFD